MTQPVVSVNTHCHIVVLLLTNQLIITYYRASFNWNAHILGAPDNVEYVLSSQEDGMVAYRIVQMSDDDAKPSIAHANNNTATMPQQLQYIVIDNVNGYLQAVPSQTTIAASTTASIGNNSTTASVATSRPSVTIAPKVVNTETSKYANALPISTSKQSVRTFDERNFASIPHFEQ